LSQSLTNVRLNNLVVLRKYYPRILNYPHYFHRKSKWAVNWR